MPTCVNHGEPGNPRVTVCLLAYNHDHVIGEAIESVLAQSFDDYEFIVSDDSSTDNTWKVICDYASRYPRVHPIKTPRTLGMPGNANYAVSHARGKYIALLHHDDLLDSELLLRWVGTMEKDDRIAFVFNDYQVTGGVASHKSEGREFREIMYGKDFYRKHLASGWGCPVRGTALIRKYFYDKSGGMELSFGMLSDIDLWMRLSLDGYVGYVSEPLITVRHCRKEGYPDEYNNFSWGRWRILFDIHARNAQHAKGGHVIDKDGWPMLFRWKVSVEVLKWLLYGLVKRKKEIILRSGEGENRYEYVVVKIIRNFLVGMFSWRNSNLRPLNKGPGQNN